MSSVVIAVSNSFAFSVSDLVAANQNDHNIQ